MDNSNKSQPEIAVDLYLQSLRAKANYTDADILELRSHLLDAVEDLKKTGLDNEEAFLIAKKRLGGEEELSAEFNKVNNGAGTDVISFLLGIAFFILLSSLYAIGLHYFYYFVLSGTLQAKPAIWFMSIFQIAVAAMIIIYAKSVWHVVHYLNRKVKEQPVLISLLAFLIISTVMILSVNNEAVSLLNNSSSVDRGNYSAYFGERKWSIFVPFIIPCSFLLAMFISFYKFSTTNRFSIKALLSGENLLFFYIYGVCFKILASMTFMISNSLLVYKQLYFGIIYFVGVFTVIYFSNRNTAKKMFWFFVIAGFQIETFVEFTGKARPENRAAVYIAMFFAALAGILFGKLFKQKNISIKN